MVLGFSLPSLLWYGEQALHLEFPEEWNVSFHPMKGYHTQKLTEKQMLNLQRTFIVLFGALGLLLLTQFDTVLSMALYAYSLVGASITPVLLAAFLWKRVTPQGGVACIAGGMGTIIGLDLYFFSQKGIFTAFVLEFFLKFNYNVLLHVKHFFVIFKRRISYGIRLVNTG